MSGNPEASFVQGSALQLPLEMRKYGVRVALLDAGLLPVARLVLAARGNVPLDKLQRELPGIANIGPVEQIAQIVNAALPGIGLHPLPAPPPQLPDAPQTTYFELDRSSETFPGLSTSRAIAVCIAPEEWSQELELELWAIHPQAEQWRRAQTAQRTVPAGTHLLPLGARKFGVRVVALDAAIRAMLGTARFVLAARGRRTPDELRETLPGNCMVCPAEQLAQRVNMALPGIGLQPLPAPPPQLPAADRTAYFELDQSSPVFHDLGNSRGIAIFASGALSDELWPQELALELWAIDPPAGPTAGGTA